MLHRQTGEPAVPPGPTPRSDAFPATMATKIVS